MSETANSAHKAAARTPLRVDWRLVIGLLVWTALLFGIGYGASKALRDWRGDSVALTTQAAAASVDAPPFGVSAEEIESLPWRDAAAKINASKAAQILAEAGRGDAFARTVACLGHMGGVEGFLPSPAAAKAYCDAASEQNYRPALYLSWALSRSAPHAGVTAEVARTRLKAASDAGLAAAQVDYAQTLSDQVEAGRLLLAAAEQGDARGQFFYARWLRDSPAGPRDPAASVPFLERAAGANQNDAAHMLATLYRDGIGVPRNRDRALALYEQAADRNFAPSMFNYADLIRERDAGAAAALYARLACMSDEREISAMAGARLRAMGQAARC